MCMVSATRKAELARDPISTRIRTSNMARTNRLLYYSVFFIANAVIVLFGSVIYIEEEIYH